MKQSFTTTWQGDTAFDTEIGGHTVRTEATEEYGGSGSAPSPKPLMIAALAGCTGIDVVSILNKMKVEVDGFSIDIQTEQTEELPSVYSSMHIVYRFTGKHLDKKKLNRAVELSQTKYCGVSAMYKKAMPVTYDILIHE